MQIHTSDDPAKAAGMHISESIASHDGDVLCLLSGGSALDIIDYINIHDKNECRTIFIMGDERVSREESINNYLQLKGRYPEHLVTKLSIETVPNENESSEDYADRIEKKFLKIISELKDPKIISVLGMGTDGHTAGIFPMDQESFQETYRDDGTYVSVHAKGLTIDSRASITPSWLLNEADEIIAFIAGESKHVILESLINESKELYERPAELIKRHKNAHLFTDIFIEPK